MIQKLIIPILFIGALALSLVLLVFAGLGIGVRVEGAIFADESRTLLGLSGAVLIIVLLALGAYLRTRSSIR